MKRRTSIKLTLRDGVCAEGCGHKGIVHRTVAGCYKCIDCIKPSEMEINKKEIEISKKQAA